MFDVWATDSWTARAADPNIHAVLALCYVFITLSYKTQGRRRWSLPLWAQAYYMFMSSLSGCMALVLGVCGARLYAEEGAGEWPYASSGPEHSWCVRALSVALWVFIMSKPVEFIDTAIQMRRNFPIRRLHWVHHATVPLICAVYFHERSILFVFGSFTNSLTHTFMYAYYALTSRSKRMRRVYAPMVFGMQISQFVTGLLLVQCYIWTTVHFLDLYPASVFVTFTVYAYYLAEFMGYGVARWGN